MRKNATSLHEIVEGHFVYCQDEEVAAYRQKALNIAREITVHDCK